MSMISSAWILAKKDLRAYFRDRPALILGFLVPIALVTVFGWIMSALSGGSGKGMPKVALTVVDEDGSEWSAHIVKELRASDVLRVEPKDGSPALSRQDAQQKVRDGDISHALIIPKGFRFDAASQDSPQLLLIRDPGREMEQTIIQIGLIQSLMIASEGKMWLGAMGNILRDAGIDDRQIAMVESAGLDMQKLIGGFLEESRDKQLAARDEKSADEDRIERDVPLEGTSNAGSDGFGIMKLATKLLALKQEDITPPSRPKNVTYQVAQSVSGVIVMMLLFSLTGCGSILLAERENGSLKRLLALPIPKSSIVLGKLCFMVIVGLIQLAVLFLYAELMFRVGLFRDPWTLSILALSWVLAGCGFGLFIAASAKSSRQADSLATVIILVMAALGGCWFPTQLMQLPYFLDLASKSMMTYWAMSGFQGMLWNQLDLTSGKMLYAIAWQWGWASLLVGLAVYFFKRNFCRG